MTGRYPPGAGDGPRPPTADPGARCSGWHRMELGSYVLGALDSDEADQVRRHLLTCQVCRAEYRELAAVPAVLARISETEMAAGPVPPGGELLARLLARAAEQEGSSDVGLAAASAGRARGHRRAVVRRPSRALARWWGAGPVQRFSVALAGAALTACVVVGVGLATAPSAVASKTLSSTDSATGVHGVVQYHAVSWGSWVQVTMYNVPPGDDCSLIAVDAKGDRSVASTWFAPSSGTATIPGGVAMEADSIVRFDVVTATGATLLEIPAN